MSKRKRLDKEPFECEITDLSHDGRGVAKQNEKVVFVQNALPGERVMAQLNRKTRNFNEAMAIKILMPSSDRVEPKCDYYNNCNGCTMMHLNPKKQIQFKANTLKQNFKKMAAVEPENWLPALEDKQWEYRRRARLSVRWVPGKGRVLVGFREKNGRYVADMNDCEVLENQLARLINPLSDLITAMDAKADIPQLECSVGDNTTALIIRHMKPLSVRDIELLTHFGDNHGLQIFLQSKGPKTILPLASSYPPLYFSLQNNLKMEFKPNDFIQVNSAMNNKMIAQALSLLSPNKNEIVLDLFCGLGNFTLPFACAAHEVVGIEGEESLVNRAQHNAQINNINNVEFYCADLTQDQTGQNWFNKTYDKVIVDPPRSGAWEILPMIAQTGAKTLLYVSCHPASLARDADRLINEFGFSLKTAGVMDMFPHTSHVESMALFTKV